MKLLDGTEFTQEDFDRIFKNPADKRERPLFLSKEAQEHWDKTIKEYYEYLKNKK